jgi:hypothetical protein
MRKPPIIATSTLSKTPRYYVAFAYKARQLKDGQMLVEITGQKWDVTEQVEAIVAKRLQEREA